jgi:hypothetical protein
MQRAFADTARPQVNTAINVQREFFETLGELNRAWFSRLQSHAILPCELAGKLAATRSMPDAARACQEFMSRQMEMLAEDGRRMVSDSERIVKLGARLMSNGSIGAGS